MGGHWGPHFSLGGGPLAPRRTAPAQWTDRHGDYSWRRLRLLDTLQRERERERERDRERDRETERQREIQGLVMVRVLVAQLCVD